MSQAILKVPVTLRAITDNRNELPVDVGTVAEILSRLADNYPALKQKLLVDGQISPYMNIYLNGKDIRFLSQLDTRVDSGDVLTVLPTVAGG